MKRLFLAALVAASILSVSAASLAHVNLADENLADENVAGKTVQAAVTTTAQPQPFVKKRYSIKGEWSLKTVDGKAQITFSDAFKTKGGPDLKVYLSKQSLAELESGNVTSQSTRIAVLKSNKGAQTYVLPDDISLSDYKSVVIHCEAFSVLWGGFDLPLE